MKFKTYLKKLGACPDAIEWIGDRTPQQAWDECDRPDWLLWLYRHNTPDKKICVKIAIKAARLGLPVWQAAYPNDHRPEKAIVAAEGWIKNPSENAADAAALAAYAAYAAADAAALAATGAASRAAYAASLAADAAFRTADAASRAAHAAYATGETAAYATADAGHVADVKIANYIRTLIPKCPIEVINYD